MDVRCVHAEIMYNRTAVGVVYNSSAPCPYPEGPCSCTNGSDETSVHSCKPWETQRFPFGSEFAFDTTGQEEVYIWARQGVESAHPSIKLLLMGFLASLASVATLSCA